MVLRRLSSEVVCPGLQFVSCIIDLRSVAPIIWASGLGRGLGWDEPPVGIAGDIAVGVEGGGVGGLVDAAAVLVTGGAGIGAVGAGVAVARA